MARGRRALAYSRTVLRISDDAYAEMIGHAYDGLPDEACGLLGGHADRPSVELFFPCRNTDASSRTYSIGPDDWGRAEQAFDAAGLEMVGVMHSHTHTDAYPSPTDVDKADNPFLVGWHYVIVSLSQDHPMLRSYLLDDRNIVEEPVVRIGRT